MINLYKKIIVFVLLFAAIVAVANGNEKCVQIFYDSRPSAKQTAVEANFGKIHSIFLQNLLGHFPHIQQYLIPIEKYKKGDLDKCHASIYLGTYFNNTIPVDFFTDYVKTEKNVVWAGYNIWKLEQDVLYRLWKVKYQRLTKLDYTNMDQAGRPGFFKYYDYKGETFIKHGEYNNKIPSTFLAAFEITQFEYKSDEVEPYALSWARHSTVKSKTPYILRNQNHWYIGDSPFSFMTEEDRYLIFADILFDILDEEPRFKGKKPAVFRIEDVHVKLPLWPLFELITMLDKRKVPFTIALIPLFSDPFGMFDGKKESLKPIASDPLFMRFLDFAKKSNAGFVFHGVTHQYGRRLNPHNAVSGDDFEFWNIVKNKPVDRDSAKFVIKRIEAGLSFLEDAKIKICAWEVPHYQASPLDYTIFAEIFNWNLGRIVYFPHEVKNRQEFPVHFSMENSGAAGNGKRLEYFSKMKVSYPKHLLPSGQFYPYEIYGDIYGQRVLPENVGNFQPYFSSHVPSPKTVDDLIRIVKRNSILRDVWASFFMHPHLVNTTTRMGLGGFPGDTRELERFIVEIRKAGYEFIDLKTFAKNNVIEKRKRTIIK